MKVFVVSTGTANTASVIAGLQRSGAEPVLSHDPSELERADRIVLPGVGAFEAARQTLESENLLEVLDARIKSDRPTLGICLGLQLLCETSEESPGSQGLGTIQGHITRFPSTVRVPQLGWNRVTPNENCRFLTEGYAYFANSYRLVDPPKDWGCALSEHAGPFVAAVERGQILACQFHPELSGKWGQELIRRWLHGAPSC